MSEAKRRDAGRSDTALHAVMASIGVAALALMLGVFLYEAIRGTEEPPVIALSAAGVKQAGAAWLVRVEARNSGHQTAAQVQIEGALEGGGETETATLVLDYLPDGSTRTGGLYFRQDPAQGELTLRVLGYSDP